MNTKKKPTSSPEAQVFRTQELMDMDLANCQVTQRELPLFGSDFQWVDNTFNRELFRVYERLGKRLLTLLQAFAASEGDIPSPDLLKCRLQFQLIQSVLSSLPYLDGDDVYHSVNSSVLWATLGFSTQEKESDDI